MIDDSANTVDEKLGNQYGDYARYAAEAIAGAATALDNEDIDDLVNEARDFVRKSPAVAIGAAAIAGFVLMRLVKPAKAPKTRSEEHTSELQYLMRISYAVFCFKKKIHNHQITQ